MVDSIVNLADSVRQRLRNLATEPQQIARILDAFAFERLLYRLSVSQFRNRFMLKGGMLVMLWVPGMGRFTRDVDFLAFDANDENLMRNTFAEILAIDAGDGLVFDTVNIGSEPILKDDEYGGTRLRTTANLGKTKMNIAIDLGFGYAPVDSKYEVVYNSLLDFPPASIRAYSPASVVAEKFHAIVTLGKINTRIKDYFDLAMLPKSLDIEAKDLKLAIRMTFDRRGTKVPSTRPIGLSEIYWEDPKRIMQWEEYAEGTELAGTELATIIEDIWVWLAPVCSMFFATDVESSTIPQVVTQFPDTDIE